MKLLFTVRTNDGGNLVANGSIPVDEKEWNGFTDVEKAVIICDIQNDVLKEMFTVDVEVAYE